MGFWGERFMSMSGASRRDSRCYFHQDLEAYILSLSLSQEHSNIKGVFHGVCSFYTVLEFIHFFYCWIFIFDTGECQYGFVEFFSFLLMHYCGWDLIFECFDAMNYKKRDLFDSCLKKLWERDFLSVRSCNDWKVGINAQQDRVLIHSLDWGKNLIVRFLELIMIICNSIRKRFKSKSCMPLGLITKRLGLLCLRISIDWFTIAWPY